MAGSVDDTSILIGAKSPEERKRVLADLFVKYTDRLKAMVRLRLDPRLKGRLDPSDVLQEAYLEASRRLEEYTQKPALPFHLWLRLITGQRLLDLARYHTRARRDARHDQPLPGERIPEATSLGLTDALIEDGTSPSQAAAREELRQKVTEALESMDPVDREVLALRHFEQLSNGEVAGVLGIEESAASKRYFRALDKLRKIVGNNPGEGQG
jgi:RNA polymerase sigma-70 factor (ECF subfamily)